MAENETENPRRAFPEAMLINQSFFEMDIFDEGGPREGKPSYKFEIALDKDDVVGEGKFEDYVIDCACEEWGESAEQDVIDGKIKWFVDGDKLAKKREEKGKSGDAYKGKVVFRGHTIYNADGTKNAPGGIKVYDAAVERIAPVNAGEIYRGCFGVVGVTLNAYIDSKTDEKCISYYLVGFQKTRDGERLTGGGDDSDLFKAVGKQAEGRRSRKG